MISSLQNGNKKLFRVLIIFVIKLMKTILKNVPLLVVFYFVSALLYYHSFHDKSYAQWILQPPPPPGPPQSVCCNDGENLSDTTPPKISILTDSLHKGNNVIKLKILDESPLIIRGISYSVGNKTVVTYLAKEHNSEYIALLKVLPPYTNVEVKAIDVNGNFALEAKKIKVDDSGFSAFFSSLTNSSFWKGLFFGGRAN